MKETKFIEQNKEKWKKFESLLEKEEGKNDPHSLTKLFVQITDDLSYSRTFYPNRSVRVYLNNLAQQIFFHIYKNRKASFAGFIFFWTDELPLIMYDARKALRASFLFFVLAMIIGMFSCYMDQDFLRVILGDAYMNMTVENIRSGDPMAVYKQRGAFDMTLGITINNLLVAFKTFFLGLFFSIGTLAILLFNGIMLGSFQYFFIEQGLFVESFLTIWMHGTLEISAIIIAGAAGITLGQGLVFPGTYSRLQAFQLSARKGLKIIMGIVPLIIIAGFIEGFFTRYTDAPDLLRLFFILSCLTFVLYYFVWLPRKKVKRNQAVLKKTKIPGNKIYRFDTKKIYSPGELFALVFVFYRKQLGSYFKIGILATTAYCIILSLLPGDLSDLFYFPSKYDQGPIEDQIIFTLQRLDQFFSFETQPFLPLINLITFFPILLWTYSNPTWKRPNMLPAYFNWSIWGKILFGIIILHLLLLSSSAWINLFVLFMMFPLVFLWIYSATNGQTSLTNGFIQMINLAKQRIGAVLILFFLVVCLTFLTFLVTDSILFGLYIDSLIWSVAVEVDQMKEVYVLLKIFFIILLINLLLPLMIISMSLLFHSLLEIREARGLLKKIEQIGQKNQVSGLEKE